MDKRMREVVLRCLDCEKKKRIPVDDILIVIRRQTPFSGSDFELQDHLLEILRSLESEELLKLPKSKTCWDNTVNLPRYVTAIRKEAEEAKRQRKKRLDCLRNETAWEPGKMVSFAHTLSSLDELERAVQVNRYLLAKGPDRTPVPHRERALMIFGNEKALDNYIHSGLFNGQVTLADLDCFYCPEPLPFSALSMDTGKTEGKPLLVVENAGTYWSCRQANETVKRYAAVVYGKGFKIMAKSAEKANDGLLGVEKQLRSKGVAYFGDLDPAGIAIPIGINEYRNKTGLSPLYAEYPLYRELLRIGRPVSYDKKQERYHDPVAAKAWLGEELAAQYLKEVHDVRRPQEGLTAADIEKVLKL